MRNPGRREVTWASQALSGRARMGAKLFPLALVCWRGAGGRGRRVSAASHLLLHTKCRCPLGWLGPATDAGAAGVWWVHPAPRAHMQAV